MSGLKRRLSLAEAVGLSLSIVAPTLTAAFNISLVVGKAGAAAPATFAVGTLLVALVAVAFVSFARREGHAGSAYAYIGAVFGRRAGFLAGWTLLLTYLGFAAAMSVLVGDFLASALADFGVRAPWLWGPIALLTLALSTGLAWRDVRLAGRLMLGMELASLLAILVLCGLILDRAPAPPAEALRTAAEPRGWSGAAYALVFVVLSFAGFEGAATLGEETRRPGRDVPLAMMAAVVGAGAFFTFASYCEVRGYGLARIGDLARATAPLDDLANRYANRTFAAGLDLAAAFSSFAGALGSLTASGRLFFALGRAGLAAPLARTHPTRGAPGPAILAAGLLAGGLVVCFAPSSGAATFYADVSTVAVLAVILVYLGVIAAQCRLDLGDGRRLAPALTILGALVLVWSLVNTVVPVPPWPGYLWPYAVLAWILLGALLALARPALVRRAALEPSIVEPAVKAGLTAGEA